MGEGPPAVSQRRGEVPRVAADSGGSAQSACPAHLVAPGRQRDLTVFHVCQVPEFLKLKRYDK